MKTDNGGLATTARVKVSLGKGSTWATRLSQIGKSSGEIIICTYSLPNLDYMSQILDKRSDITIVCHKKFQEKASILQQKYPRLNIILKSDIHAKMVLIQPETVILSSANFGSSGWLEHTITVKSESVYSYYYNRLKGVLNYD